MGSLSLRRVAQSATSPFVTTRVTRTLQSDCLLTRIVCPCILPRRMCYVSAPPFVTTRVTRTLYSDCLLTRIVCPCILPRRMCPMCLHPPHHGAVGGEAHRQRVLREILPVGSPILRKLYRFSQRLVRKPVGKFHRPIYMVKFWGQFAHLRKLGSPCRSSGGRQRVTHRAAVP